MEEAGFEQMQAEVVARWLIYDPDSLCWASELSLLV